MKYSHFLYQYDTDSVFLDGLYEFHPEAFEELDPDDLEILRRYYLVGIEDIPGDVHKYLRRLRQTNPGIDRKAARALGNLRRIIGAGETKL
ncbi:MAG: hypothetical protein ACM3N0_01900 [Chloroflexota bacterium]